MSKDKQLRRLIAMEAARLMAEHGIKDYYTAKRKAATQFNSRNTSNMPGNEEIEAALAEYQRLFQADTQPQHVQQLRAAALHVMQLFSEFDAHLVGSVLSGTAHAHSDINLHLFAATAEDVGLVLLQENIPYETTQRYLRLAKEGSPLAYPGYRFIAGDTVIELTVFPQDGLRQTPRSPVDGKPMQRASRATVARLNGDVT